MFKLASDFLSLDFLRQQNQKNKPESQFSSLPISQITKEGKVLAIILRREFNQEGIHFLTPDDFSQQLAYMRHPTGKSIMPHVHNKVQREVFFTQEVLIIKRGKLRVDFYDDDQQYLESHILRDGDVVLLVQGGHGFQVLEEVEMIEVKQGPYVGNQDKTRFTGIEETVVKMAGAEMA
ncbi:MAG: hypothetical protein GPJ17_02005 [Microcystis aeruginosa K13-07]|nr:hypothetical protein [Microcystis aeruginosa K13-07]